MRFKGKKAEKNKEGVLSRNLLMLNLLFQFYLPSVLALCAIVSTLFTAALNLDKDWK